MYPTAVRVDRQFALDFATFLDNRVVAPNGHAHTKKRRLRGQTFVIDTVRALFEWADDPHRGNYLPAGFRNPFRRATLKRRVPATDPLGAPDITVDMATDFARACDDYQLALFMPTVLYGLRAAEPVFLFREHIQGDWLRVACLPELAYTTKGQRDKRLPLLDGIAELWNTAQPGGNCGLVLVRRTVASGSESPPLLGNSLNQLIHEYERHCEQAKATSAAAKQKIRDGVIRDAGGLTYDLVNGEFHRIARRLKWPARATLKDFRHLFATVLANGGMPEHERRYLMGHAPGKEAIVTYTNMDRLADHYRCAVEREYAALLTILRSRVT